jgi:NDP-sugar pyrophosphorylase family protein
VAMAPSGGRLRTAVILAGGLGQRLRPLTNIIPKPLLPIGTSTIIEIQLMTLKRFGFDRVLIASNYHADYFESFLGRGDRYGIDIFFSREEKPLGTCGPLSLLRQHLDNPFLMINGDILTQIDYHRLDTFAAERGAPLTVVTKEINIPFRFGRVLADGDFITEIEEKPNYKQEILAGIYVMLPEVIDMVPVDTYYGVDQLIKDMLAAKRPIAKYLMHEYWIDVGQLDDYEIAKQEMEKHQQGMVK